MEVKHFSSKDSARYRMIREEYQMFKYRVYSKAEDASRPTMIAATDFRDVALYIKDNIAAAFVSDSDKRVEITITEAIDADYFSRLRKDNSAEA